MVWCDGALMKPSLVCAGPEQEGAQERSVQSGQSGGRLGVPADSSHRGQVQQDRRGVPDHDAAHSRHQQGMNE